MAISTFKIDSTSEDCTSINLKAISSNGLDTVTVIKNPGSAGSTTHTIVANLLNPSNNIYTIDGSFLGGVNTDSLDGVWKITGTELGSGLTSETGTVISCIIDCCLAKKLNADLSGCGTCNNCGACNNIDLIAQIFILAESAKYSAAVREYSNATEKYNKAIDLCANDCTCSGC